MIVLIFPYQTPFLLPHVFYFPPNLHFPQLITGLCLLWPGQDRGQRSLMGTAVFSLVALVREEWCVFVLWSSCAFYTLWSSGLTPGKGQHHLYICDHATAFSNHLSIKFGGFPTHVARKKLSQFSPWRWSNLFLNQAGTRYPYHFLKDKISRSCALCFFHLMCEV